MKIRLFNARLISFANGDTRVQENMQVGIEDGKILYVASDEDNVRGNYTWDIERNCEGNLLLPGFKNCHTHSAMTFLRSKADDLPLHEWLNETVFPAEAKLTPEDIETFTKLAILEYLQSGITGIFEMYLTPDSIAKACRESGMRITMTGGVNNFSQSVELLEKWIQEYNESRDLVKFVPGFHAEYTCSKELLCNVSQLAHQYRIPVYAHIAETAKEVEECKAKYGMTPAVFLDSLGMFEFGGGGFHCVHMTSEDMDVFRKRRMYVITNPGSNTKLASGIAPIAEYERRKIPVAIGTDGPASNNCLDMFREMFLVTGLSKLREQDAASMDAMRVLRMATVHGAKAMHLNKADTLSKGKFADIIMIDLHQPNMQPIHNIPKNLVYSGSKSNVIMTMINGKIPYRNGEFNIGENPETIYAKCDKIVKRMLSE